MIPNQQEPLQEPPPQEIDETYFDPSYRITGELSTFHPPGTTNLGFGNNWLNTPTFHLLSRNGIVMRKPIAPFDFPEIVPLELVSFNTFNQYFVIALYRIHRNANAMRAIGGIGEKKIVKFFTKNGVAYR